MKKRKSYNGGWCLIFSPMPKNCNPGIGNYLAMFFAYLILFFAYLILLLPFCSKRFVLTINNY